MQHEIGIHNLDVLNRPGFGIIKALFNGDFSSVHITLRGFFTADKLFFTGYTLYFLIAPLIVIFFKGNYLREKFSYNPPSYLFLVSIWTNIILFGITAHIHHYQFFMEVCEMIMAYGVLMYVAFYLCPNPE